MHSRGNSIYEFFPGAETTVAAVARYMIRHGLTPEDVLASHDAWLANRMREMVPAGDGSRRGGSRTAPITRKTGRRYKAGDYAVMPRACPRCGGDVELYQMCPIESPRWRTQAACMADACAWHGKSRLPIDALLAAGAANIKNSVESGARSEEFESPALRAASPNSSLHSSHSSLKKTEG